MSVLKELINANDSLSQGVSKATRVSAKAEVKAASINTDYDVGRINELNYNKKLAGELRKALNFIDDVLNAYLDRTPDGDGGGGMHRDNSFDKELPSAIGTLEYIISTVVYR